MTSGRAPNAGAMLELERVSCAAGRVQLLSDVSLRVAAGGPTAIIGPNGAGKTTLLRMLMGLIAPTGGRLNWIGVVPRRAIVFQRPVMLRRTVAGNMAFALAAAGVPRDRRAIRARALLDLVGLQPLWDRPARRLSAGEQQRLALARALTRDPALLLLDEPTASLDPAASRSLEELVQTISSGGTTVLIATHDLGQARRIARDVVLLHAGRLVETAPATSFFAAPGTPLGRAFIAGELLP